LLDGYYCRQRCLHGHGRVLNITRFRDVSLGMVVWVAVGERANIDDGGGMAHCRAQVENNTIIGNTAYGSKKGSGGGLFKCLGPICNCIIWTNTASADVNQITGCATPDYSCIQQWTGEGVGNIYMEPLFADANGPDNNPYTYEDNDYHLTSGSPCIDAGANADWMAEAADLDGNPRIFNGTVDMGVYEFMVQSMPTGFSTDEGLDLVDSAITVLQRPKD
jgi:hypothetical protein